LLSPSLALSAILRFNAGDRFAQTLVADSSVSAEPTLPFDALRQRVPVIAHLIPSSRFGMPKDIDRLERFEIQPSQTGARTDDPLKERRSARAGETRQR
jgi:hypothetical protein